MPYRPEAELKRPDLKGEFVCATCHKTFCHAASLNRHRLNFHGGNHYCTICKCIIPPKETVRRHMSQHGFDRIFTCGCCNWAFPDKKELHIHTSSMAKHNEPGPAQVIATTANGKDGDFSGIGMFKEPLASRKNKETKTPASLGAFASSAGAGGGGLPPSQQNSPAPGGAAPNLFCPTMVHPTATNPTPSPADLYNHLVLQMASQLQANGLGSLASSQTMTWAKMLMENNTFLPSGFPHPLLASALSPSSTTSSSMLTPKSEEQTSMMKEIKVETGTISPTDSAISTTVEDFSDSSTPSSSHSPVSNPDDKFRTSSVSGYEDMSKKTPSPSPEPSEMSFSSTGSNRKRKLDDVISFLHRKSTTTC